MPARKKDVEDGSKTRLNWGARSNPAGGNRQLDRNRFSVAAMGDGCALPPVVGNRNLIVRAASIRSSFITSKKYESINFTLYHLGWDHIDYYYRCVKHQFVQIYVK